MITHYESIGKQKKLHNYFHRHHLYTPLHTPRCTGLFWIILRPLFQG